MLNKEKVLEALGHDDDPELHHSLADLKMVREVQVYNGRVEVAIALTMPNCPLKDQIKSDVSAAIAVLPELLKSFIRQVPVQTKEKHEWERNLAQTGKHTRKKYGVGFSSGMIRRKK